MVNDPATKLGQGRMGILKANPVIANVPAIVKGNFILVDSVEAQPGPSTVRAVERMAKAFHPEAFGN